MKIDKMTTKEFNLSEKITNDDISRRMTGICYSSRWDFIFVEDVKEFIKRLKEIVHSYTPIFSINDCMKEIEKLAGDKLIK